jgi:hypothetical protein
MRFTYVFQNKPHRKNQAKLRGAYEDNIKMDLWEMECGMGWTISNRVQRKAVVILAMLNHVIHKVC